MDREALVAGIKGMLQSIDRDRITESVAGREVFAHYQKEFSYKTFDLEDGRSINVPVSNAIKLLDSLSTKLLEELHGNKRSLDILNYAASHYDDKQLVDNATRDVLAYYSGTTTVDDIDAVDAAFEAVTDTRRAFDVPLICEPRSPWTKEDIGAVFNVAFLLRQHEGAAWRYPRENAPLIPMPLREVITDHPANTELISKLIISNDRHLYSCDSDRLREQLQSSSIAVADGVL